VTRFRFYHPIQVRYVEVDAQRHVYFGHYLTYFDVALLEYMRAIGYDYDEMVAGGVDMFYVDASCQYKGRARFDDTLHVHARIARIGNTSFTFEFAAYRVNSLRSVELCGTPEDVLVATGQIVAVAVDVQTEVPVRVPDGLREAVARYEESGDFPTPI
jgi:acyl-CoA thioester hydrolase